MPLMPTARYKDFPPGWNHLLIPTSSRAAALAGLTLYAPCRLSGVLAQRAARASIRVFGPRALPGPTSAWQPVMAEDVWRALTAQWERELGPFDEVAGYRRGTGRVGMSLLLLTHGDPLAFVKVARDAAAALERTRCVMERVCRSRPQAFRVPAPRAAGEVDGWQYLALSPLPPSCHAPPKRPPLEAILDEIAHALEALARPADTPPTWRAMHGDFTPWNLRQVGRRLFLIDWDDAGWGPPHADLVLYLAAEGALGRHAHRPSLALDLDGAREAVEFWSGRIRAHVSYGERDQRLARSLLTVLGRMGAAPAGS